VIISIKLADIVFTAVSQHASINLELNQTYFPFQITNCQADISFHYLPSQLSSFQNTQLIFDSGGSHRIYRWQEKYLIPVGTENRRIATFDFGFTHGEVYNSLKDIERSQSLVTIYLFEHPLDQLALVNYLAQGRGVLLHSCGLVYENQGLLFAGMSGAGKSTIAHIWQAAGEKILGYDRIVIRRRNGSLHMYGTPWQGEARISSPDRVPLENIFFLAKASQNFIRPLAPMEATTRLLTCSFPPFYHKDGMEFILDFFLQIVAETPCYELGFVPEARVIDFIKSAL
jgi:hypothetical protein